MNFIKRYERLFGFIIAVLSAVLIGCISIRIWQIDLSVMPGIGGDGTLGSFFIKSMEENGWKGLYFNQRVGAPDGSSLIDVPFMDIDMAFVLWIINFVTNDFAKTYYVFYILTYAMSAAGMFMLLEKMEVAYWLNSAISFIFAIAPFHFFRAMGHMSLSNYVTVPLGIYLAFAILEGEMPVIKKRKERKIFNYTFTKVMWLAIIVGFGQLYYAFFSLIVMAVALLFRLIKKKSFKVLIREGIIVYITSICFLIGIFPKIFYGWRQGKNLVAGIRVPMESELYGMKIIELLMPVSYSRVGKLREFTEKYVTSGVWVSENTLSSLGIVSSIAFIFICCWLVYFFFAELVRNDYTEKMQLVSISTLILVLFCTVGGFGTIFNFLVSPQIRAYNRASIVINCLVLTAAAITMQRITKKKLLMVTGIVLVAVAIYDQVLIMPNGWQESAKIQQEEYESFFSSIEEELGKGAMVYELPYMNFPESPGIYNMLDYTHFLGYIFTDDIYWSYGGVIGRDETAKELYIDEGMSTRFLQGIKEAGFDGLYIDTYGFEDQGKEITGFYKKLIKSEPIISSDGRFFLYLIG